MILEKNLPMLKIGSLVAKYPVVQGGMGVKISGSGLAAAVANQDGIGVIAAADIGADESDFHRDPLAANVRALLKEIRRARELSTGIIAVNIMFALTHYAEMAQAAIEEGVDIIFSGAGIPKNLPEFLKGSTRTQLVPIVSSAKAALLIAKYWYKKYEYVMPAVVVEGPGAGGHLGFKAEDLDNPDFSLENIVPEVIEELKAFESERGVSVAVIAAGGIYTGADILKFIRLGAKGVQMATRFVTTHECDAAIEFKLAYINSRPEDLIIIKSPVGMPGRAIRGKFLDAVARGERTPIKCPFKCLKTCDPETAPYCISCALINAYKGKLLGGFVFAGINAHRATEIIHVEKLFQDLKDEYAEAVAAA